MRKESEIANPEERKLKPISNRQVRIQEAKNITSRFMEEIDRICLEGRVKNITTLEKDLLLSKGTLGKYANGRMNVEPYIIQRAKRIYNIDLIYVIMNISDPEHAGPWHNRTDLRKFKPFDRKVLGRHAPVKKEVSQPD